MRFYLMMCGVDWCSDSPFPLIEHRLDIWPTYNKKLMQFCSTAWYCKVYNSTMCTVTLQKHKAFLFLHLVRSRAIQGSMLIPKRSLSWTGTLREGRVTHLVYFMLPPQYPFSDLALISARLDLPIRSFRLSFSLWIDSLFVFINHHFSKVGFEKAARRLISNYIGFTYFMCFFRKKGTRKIIVFELHN
jgi:hypothetical protein